MSLSNVSKKALYRAVEYLPASSSLAISRDRQLRDLWGRLITASKSVSWSSGGYGDTWSSRAVSLHVLFYANIWWDKLLYMRLKVAEYNGLYEKSLNGDVIFISNDLDSGKRDGYMSQSPGSSPRPRKSTLNQLSGGKTTSNMGLQTGKETPLSSKTSKVIYTRRKVKENHMNVVTGAVSNTVMFA